MELGEGRKFVMNINMECSTGQVGLIYQSATFCENPNDGIFRSNIL